VRIYKTYFEYRSGQGDPIGEKFTLITHDEFDKFRISLEYRQIKNKAAAASAAFKHVVRHVLSQDDESLLLMKALERSDITIMLPLPTLKSTICRPMLWAS
jgi:hypothetical protein